MMRRRAARTVRENYRLVILIVVIATAVSLSLDFFWRAKDAMSRAQNDILYAAPPPAAPGTTGSFNR